MLSVGQRPAVRPDAAVRGRCAFTAGLLVLVFRSMDVEGCRLTTLSLHTSSFLWFIFRILQGNPKKELLWSRWVGGIRLNGCAIIWGLLKQVLVTAFREGSATQTSKRERLEDEG